MAALPTTRPTTDQPATDRQATDQPATDQQATDRPDGDRAAVGRHVGSSGPRLPVNPVLPGFYPDPSVCRAGDRYYLASSTFEYFPGLPVHVSDDLVHWTPVGSVVDDAEAFDFAGMGDSKGLYAPTIRHHDGMFLVACTRVGEAGDGTGDSGFFVTASDPAGPWSEPVWVPGADGFDPSVLFDGGTVYWCATRIVRPGRFFGECEVWVREIDLGAGRLVGDETVIWRGALHGATWPEGPRLFAHEGWYYLLTAEGGTYRDHAVVVARSRAITGPYENCPRNPILTHRHLGADHPVQNVGHADLVQRHDGSWAMVALAVRTARRRHVLGRETFVAEVVWEDGWPVVNPGHGVLRDVGDRPAEREVAPARVGDALTVRGPASFATERPDGVRLTSTGEGVTEPGRPAALLYRLQHQNAVLGLDLADLDAGARAGLVLRQSTDFSVRLEVDGSRARVVHRAAGQDTEVDACDLDPGPHRVEAVLDPDEVRFSVDGRALGGAAVEVLGSEVAGGFVGTVWGPYVDGEPGAGVTVTATRYRSR